MTKLKLLTEVHTETILPMTKLKLLTVGGWSPDEIEVTYDEIEVEDQYTSFI